MEFKSGSKLMNRMFDMSDNEQKYNSIVIPATPTGFNVYDMFSGRMMSGVQGYPVLNGGIFPRLCNIIGESATGKSSKAIKDAAGAIDRIWSKYGSGYSEMYLLDPEGHTDTGRVLSLSGWSPAEFVNKCNFSQDSISLTDLANLIIRIYDTKTKYRDEFILPSGLRDIYGKEVLFLAPTFIILDSVAQVNPNGIEMIEYNKAGEMKDLERLGSNMEGAQDAKAWTMFVRKLKPFLDGGNINLMCINHKIKGVHIDPYEKKTRYLPFLDMDEKLKGGQELIYQSYQIFYILGGKRIDEKEPVYGPDINGLIVNAFFPKNKANIEGVHFPMVFNKSTGYHPELSDFEYLFQKKIGIQGTSKFKFDVLPEVQFSRKELLNTLDEFPSVARALAFTARYVAAYEMQYYNPTVPSLVHMGENVPLEQRLAMLYAYTESYGKHQNIAEECNPDHARLAREHRYSILIDYPKYLGNVMLDKRDIASAEHGYTVGGTGVTPFNMDECTNGFVSFNPERIKNIAALKKFAAEHPVTE